MKLKLTIAALAGGLTWWGGAARGAVSPWQWQDPLPQGNTYNGACAVGHEVYAVGEAGTVARFDGASWSLMTFPWKSPLRGIWGSSASDLFAVGGDPDPISDGGIYHYNGSSWSLTESPVYDLYSVWGAAADEVFAGGDGGKILFYDGGGWTDLSPGMGINYTFRGLWGTSVSDVFAAAGPYIVHWDGAGWSLLTQLGSGGDLRGIWGSSSTDVYAVRPGGKLYHYDGSGWTETTFGDGSSLYDLESVWGTASDDVYVAGGFIDARVFRYDGVSWADLTVPYKRFLNAVAGEGGLVHAFGDNGAIRTWDGSSWERVNRFNDDGKLTGVWGSSASDVYVTGGYDPWTPNEYGIGVSYPVLHFNGAAWSSFTLPEFSNEVWGSAADDVFVGGDGGSIFHYDGASWTTMTQIGYQGIMAIWGSGPADVFSLGSGPICHYDGAEWSVMTDLGQTIISAWGSSGTDVFAGGNNGLIYHYAGSAWELMTDTGNQWWSLWGSGPDNVYAVSGDYMFRYDGNSWAALDPGIQYDNFAGIWGSAADDIYVVNLKVGSGDQVWGRVHHFDGSSWLDTGIPCDNGLSSVWGSSGADVYVAGEYGALLRYRGGAFFTPTPTPARTPTPAPTLIPVKTATPVPTLIPVKTATPVPTLIPVKTRTPVVPTPVSLRPAAVGDYNGDGTSDIALFRPSSGLWLVRGLTRAYFGSSTDEVVPRDYTGDGAWDLAIYRPSLGKWMVRGVTSAFYGVSTDRTVPGDYDGDGSADIAVFRPTIGKWLVRGGAQVYYGFASDTTVPGDYNGDGTCDIAVFRPSIGKWLVRNGAQIYFGTSTDTVVPGDYTGDGSWDAAVFRPSTGRWLVKNGPYAYWGTSADTVQPGDYDGDGTLEFTVFRSSVGRWLIRGVTSAYYGASTDQPVTNP